jgi:hypothetical protein
MEEADPDACRGTADDGRVGVRPLEIKDAYEFLRTPRQDLLPTLQERVCGQLIKNLDALVAGSPAASEGES